MIERPSARELGHVSNELEPSYVSTFDSTQAKLLGEIHLAVTDSARLKFRFWFGNEEGTTNKKANRC